jgi:hypothetical protein
MQYKVTGSNKETGARMILEFEATNRAQAERKATQAGMAVNHVQEIRDEAEDSPRQSHRGEFDERSGAAGKIIVLLIIVLIIGAAWYYMRTT